MRAYQAKPLGTMAPTGISPFGRDHQGSTRLAIHWPAFGFRSGSTRNPFFTVRHLVQRPGAGHARSRSSPPARSSYRGGLPRPAPAEAGKAQRAAHGRRATEPLEASAAHRAYHSHDPAMIKRKPATVAEYTGSPSTTMPSTTAMAGLAYVNTVPRLAPTSATEQEGEPRGGRADKSQHRKAGQSHTPGEVGRWTSASAVSTTLAAAHSAATTPRLGMPAKTGRLTRRAPVGYPAAARSTSTAPTSLNRSPPTSRPRRATTPIMPINSPARRIPVTLALGSSRNARSATSNGSAATS